MERPSYLEERRDWALNGRPPKEKKIYRFKRTPIKSTTKKSKPAKKKATAKKIKDPPVKKSRITRSKGTASKDVDSPKALQKLIQRTQDVVNAWLKRHTENKWCVTCGDPQAYESGHFYPAGSFSGVRFLQTNIHLQCNTCNCVRGGNIEAYRKAMLEMYGEAYLVELEVLARETKNKKWTREELKEIIKKHKS